MIKKKHASSFKWFFIFLTGLFLLTQNATHAQVNIQSNKDLSNIRVEELSDEQVTNFWNQFQSKGYTLNDLERELRKRKMPFAEFEKLKQRIVKLTSEKTSNSNADNIQSSRSTADGSETEQKSAGDEFESLLPKIFGSELFNNKKLSFEPDLKMATPLNYQLGPGDELIIDIFGYSEESFNLKVSHEGTIKIPNVGVINVNGITIEQASTRIKQNLVKVYDRINSGQTQVSITLGNIRSIKVILIGEVVLPGTYTLPSLATVFNALYVSGGPDMNGSFRNIKIIRNNNIVGNLDVYEFIKNGSAKGNIRLQDQDIIKVYPYQKRVELKGQIKREGLYEVSKSESLKQVIDFAGGFTDYAYQDRIKVIRNNAKQKSVADVPFNQLDKFEPKTGDIYQIDRILNRFENRVVIEGAIFRPGNYAIEPGLTVKKLIENAEGVTEDAFMTRAIIYRLKEDNSLEMISFSIDEILNGKSADIILKREDKIQIASKKEVQSSHVLIINGEVLKPGKYKYAEKMKIEDLIIAAGGFKESASNKRIEVSRRKENADRTISNSEIAVVGIYDVEKDLSVNKSVTSFELKPFDIITVFALPGYVQQKTVKIEGEVLFPGSYSIMRNNERISDVIFRSGGLTANGFAEGAILVRLKSNSASQDVIKDNKLRALKKQSKDSSEANEAISLETKRLNDIVGIDLKSILKNPGSKGDLFIRDNDIIRIPELSQTVLVTGEVLYPVKIRFNKSDRFKKYVYGAGGFSAKALKKHSYIVYANGTARATKHFLFMNIYPKVKPGAEIVIPVKEERKAISTIEVVTIATSLTSMLVLVVTLLKR